MKKLLLSTILFFTIITAFAQVKISGTAKDNRGKKIIGITITLKGTYDGAVSDSSGNFSFKTFEKGDFVLEAKSVDYKTDEQKITITKDAIVINFSLKEEVNELKAVVVTAGAFEASDRKRAVTVLSPLDIVTTANANGDITAAVKTLPGAQQIGEQEGLFVRGGAGYETKQFIDGMLVNNPYYSSVPDLAQRGRFSPFLFKGTIFTTGGYSAIYGEALSAALILESIDLPEKSEVDASISTVFVGAGTQHLAKNKKSSYGINYGYTNVYPYFQVVKQKPDYYKIPQFHTAEGNFRIKTKNGFIKFYSSYNYNELGLRRPNIDSSTLKNAFDLQTNNLYTNLTWRENLGNGWKMNVGASVSTNGNVINAQIQDQNDQPVKTGLMYIDSLNFNLNNLQDLWQVRTVFEKKLSGISTFRFGGEYWYNHVKNKYASGNNFYTVLDDNLTSLFAEADVHVTNALAAKIGARFENSSIIKSSNIAPRISIAYKTGKDAQMSAAFGVFYQKPENTQLYYPVNLTYTKATHYIINYQRMNTNYTFRVEAYYKKYQSLVKTFPSVNNSGDGYAQGIEVFWRDRKTFKGVDYWISYSYLDTKRNYLYYPNQMQPDFATPHTASLVVKKFVTNWKTGFNATYSVATGRPYYCMRPDNTNTKFDILDQGTTKPYSNLGFSLNYLPNLGNQKRKTSIVFVASVTNVLNTNLIYGYNYSHDGAKKEAVTPPANQFFFIGCFLSWGVDRSQDAINNNL
jgi:hypothetical protein